MKHPNDVPVCIYVQYAYYSWLYLHLIPVISYSNDFPFTLWKFNIAMENGSFLDDLAIKRLIFHSYVRLPEGNISYLHEMFFWQFRGIWPRRRSGVSSGPGRQARAARAHFGGGNDAQMGWVDGCDWCVFFNYAPKWVKMEFEASNIGRYWELAQLWMVVIKKVWLMCNEQRKMNFGERSGDPGVHHQKLWFCRNYRWDTINEELDWTHEKKKVLTPKRGI